MSTSAVSIKIVANCDTGRKLLLVGKGIYSPCRKPWRRRPDHYRTYRERGYFRMTMCGWRFVAIDTLKYCPAFSDRANGWRVGRFIFRLRWIGERIVAASSFAPQPPVYPICTTPAGEADRTDAESEGT